MRKRPDPYTRKGKESGTPETFKNTAISAASRRDSVPVNGSFSSISLTENPGRDQTYSPISNTKWSFSATAATPSLLPAVGPFYLQNKRHYFSFEILLIQEQPRLLAVRLAVMDAEGLAVVALVAEVVDVQDLPGLVHVEQLRVRPRPGCRPGRQAEAASRSPAT